jgi:DNA adenine methylase
MRLRGLVEGLALDSGQAYPQLAITTLRIWFFISASHAGIVATIFLEPKALTLLFVLLQYAYANRALRTALKALKSREMTATPTEEKMTQVKRGDGGSAIRRYIPRMDDVGTKWHPRAKAIAGIPHPIPYQGSKRQLASIIVGYLPASCERLIEPFAGSAAVSLAAAHLRKANRFLLNDAHAPLMQLWRQIIEDPDGLARQYRQLWQAQVGDERGFYDRVRARFNGSHSPADFLYLLARCVKAAIRYNSRGEFNNSPDNRRLGARPNTMAKHVLGASCLLRDRTVLTVGDYKMPLSDAGPNDVVYMDPPYQGVCNTHNHRYASPLDHSEYAEILAGLNDRRVPFIISYDGRTGEKTFGRPLPRSLGLQHIEIKVGRSTQATLLGRDHWTYESLYLSPALLAKLQPKRRKSEQLLFDLESYGEAGWAT